MAGTLVHNYEKAKKNKKGFVIRKKSKERKRSIAKSIAILFSLFVLRFIFTVASKLEHSFVCMYYTVQYTVQYKKKGRIFFELIFLKNLV